MMEFVLKKGTATRMDVAERLSQIYASEIHRPARLGRLLTGNAAAGEDLAHEVFVRALRMSERDPDYLREPAWPWLRVTLTRLAMQRRRQLAREAARFARMDRRPQEASWSEATIDFVAALQTL